MSNSFKQCPANFSRGGEFFFSGGEAPLITGLITPLPWSLSAGQGMEKDVLERQGLSSILVSKLVMSLILEKHFVVLEYSAKSLKVLEQL